MSWLVDYLRMVRVFVIIVSIFSDCFLKFLGQYWVKLSGFLKEGEMFVSSEINMALVLI
jgi:hypothetical protein